MKNIFAVVLICSSIILADGSWYYQTPSMVQDVHFLSSNTLVAVGFGVWKSTDRGDSWTGYPLDHLVKKYSSSLFRVNFSSSLAGYAVGNKGLIFKTLNGGNSWEKINGPFDASTATYSNVAVFDMNTAIIIGTTASDRFIIKTIDGGDTWQRIDAGLTNNFFIDLKFVDDLNGWILTDDAVLKTVNGGVTWTPYPLPEIASTRMDFIDANNGIVTHNDVRKIAKTTDGGITWNLIETGVTNWGYTGGLSYCVNSTVYLTSTGGLILRSQDAGNSWTELGDFDTDKIRFYNSSIGVGFNSQSDYGYFQFTANGGQAWNKKYWVTASVYFFDQNNGWASYIKSENAPEGILRTRNGQTWEFISTTSAFNDVYSYGAFQFLNSNTGFAFANYRITPTNFGFAIVKTTDGGTNWTTLKTGTGITDYYFVDEQYGWIVYADGKIYKTLDGGSTWGEQTTNTTTLFADVFFTDENTGWVCGHFGTLLRTTNGGLLWNKIIIPGFENVNFFGLKFANASNGFVVGEQGGNGIILKTADGGLTWTDVTPPNMYGYLYGNQFEVKSAGEIYIIQSNGLICKSNDGGSSWQEIYQPGNATYNLNLSVINSSIMYVNSHGILFTDDGGITEVKNNSSLSVLPENFILEQNYPNPFNPSTTIKYSIPSVETHSGASAQNVSLKIYDVLGNEIATLVNEQKAPGNYEVQWNASGFASGVYFCRLQLEDFISVKKLLLMK